MPFFKPVICQSHSVNLRTEDRVLFFKDILDNSLYILTIFISAFRCKRLKSSCPNCVQYVKFFFSKTKILKQIACFLILILKTTINTVAMSKNHNAINYHYKEIKAPFS